MSEIRSGTKEEEQQEDKLRHVTELVDKSDHALGIIHRRIAAIELNMRIMINNLSVLCQRSTCTNANCPYNRTSEVVSEGKADSVVAADRNFSSQTNQQVNGTEHYTNEGKTREPESGNETISQKIVSEKQQQSNSSSSDSPSPKKEKSAHGSF